MARGKKGKKKEPRRHKEIEEDVKEDVDNGGQILIEPVEKIFKGDDLLELQNIFNKKDLSDVPPLIAAVTLGKFDVVKRLLKDGQAVNCLSPDSSTPLMWATRRKNLEMIDMLINRGADINLQNEEGDTALLIALQSPAWDEDSMLDFWNVVKECDNINIDQTNKVGYTMLHYVTKNQWRAMVGSLLEKGCKVNCATRKGVTPLMMAASRNHNEVVTKLLGAEPDLSLEDERGCTALCYSITFTMQKHLELLNPTLQGLLDVLQEAGSRFTLEEYLKRRLEVLLKPPTQVSNFVDVITNIILGVIRFCARSSKRGLKALLEQRIFSRVTEATEAHMEDTAYTHALLRIMLEVLRYCSCCYGGGKYPVSEDDIMAAFVADGGANVCLTVLKAYGKSQANKLLVLAALMPLCAACSGEGAPRAWLQVHYKELLPFHHRFLSVCIAHFNLNAEDHQSKILQRRVKRYRNLVTRLERGEIIFDKNRARASKLVDTESSSKLALAEKQVPEEHNALRTEEAPVIEVVVKPSENLKTKPVPQVDNSQRGEEKPPEISVERVIEAEVPVREESSLEQTIEEEKYEEREDLVESVQSTLPPSPLSSTQEDIQKEEVTHLKGAFRDISSGYSRLWRREREENYPGHLAGGDGDRIGGREDDNLSKLKAFLPGLEDKRMDELSKCWQSLVDKMELAKNSTRLDRAVCLVKQLLNKHTLQIQLTRD